ncbi:MAG: hypothetical protein NBV67_14060 [Tagaea sp.]|nr:hypothetical protein [Tagaea sp.]
MPHSVRIAWAAAALFAALAAGLIAFPPESFGARLDFLLYQRDGFAAGTALRAVAGMALAAALFAAIRSGFLPAQWARGRDRLARAPGLYAGAMAAILALAALSHLALTPWAVCTTRDSESYLLFESHRSAGYPLFLWLLRSIGADGAALFPAQAIFLLVCLAALAHSLGRLLDDRVAALAAWAFMAGNASLAGYAGYVLAESPFAGLLALHLAAVAALCARFGWGMAAAAGLTLGLAILVRPAGYAFLGALPGLVLLLASRRIVGTLAIAAVAALPLLGASAVNQLRHGFFATQDIGGYSLLGHTAHLIAPGMPSAFGDLPARLAAKTAPHRAEIDAARFPHGAWRTTMNAYNPQLYSAVLPEIGAWLAEQPAQARPDMAALAGALAREAIRHDPVGYARQIGAHYYGLWLLSFLPHGPVAVRLATCAPAPGSETAPRATPVDLFWAAATLGQFPALAIAFVACWLAVPLWLVAAKRGPAWRFAIYAALGVNAYFIGFATTQVALPRYSVVVEPWLIALLIALPAALRKR